MTRVRVVTDSTADMDQELASRLNISVVPLNVHWNGETQRDKLDLSTDDFYRRLVEDKATPKTSQPSVGQFEDLYRRLLAECDSVVSLHISSKLSGTINSAEIAANGVAPDRIAVVDTLTTTVPLGWIALRVAELAEAGAALPECVSLAQNLVPRARVIAAIDTLEYLRRGGRIGRAQAFAAGLLSIKLVFELQGGEVVPLDRVRTRPGAIRRAADATRKLGQVEQLAVLYGDDPEPARQLLAMLKDAYPDVEIGWGRIGPVLGTHTGPGVIGVGAILPE